MKDKSAETKCSTILEEFFEIKHKKKRRKEEKRKNRKSVWIINVIFIG